MDLYQIDFEWKKEVEASMLLVKDGQDNLLRVLRQFLSKLDLATLVQPGLLRAMKGDQVKILPTIPAQ